MNRLYRLLIALALPLWAPAAAAAAVAGTVVTPDGVPVEHARVSAADQDAHVLTDARGRFALPDVGPPATLIVEHPRFQPTVVEATSDGGELRIVLAGKQAAFAEEIVVAAERGGARVGPVSVAASEVDPAEEPLVPTTLAEAVETVPGVAENGQGGIFQTYSIRGVARQRIQTRIGAIPIVGERRAGVSASFLDPLLMEEIEVVRGPASTYYGSGALGGVVQASPRRFLGTEAAAGFGTNGHERYLAAGWGDDAWSAGVAWRQADNAEAADGTELYTTFTQAAAVVSRSFALGGERILTVTVAPTWGDDIGKASDRWPDQVTTYPRERHLLAEARLQGQEGWSFSLFAHPNDLVTRDEEPGLVAEVDNEAFDLGASGQAEWFLPGAVTLQAGFDWFGRRGVTAAETRVFEEPAGGSRVERLRTLDDASLDELAGFAALRWGWGRATLSVGTRLSWERQQNEGFAARDDHAWNGFAGIVVPFAEGFELTGNVGSGLRFPSLSERFFTGTTGRGGVIGNPELEPERALNADLGLRWFGERAWIAGSLFRTEIDDYVERIEVAPDVLTYVNLTEGTIEGIELEGGWQVGPAWSLAAQGHWLEGEDAAGAPLGDVPVARISFGPRWQQGPWRADARWQWRDGKDDPGPGEEAIASADLVSAALTWVRPDAWEITLGAENLLDETFFATADRRAPLAAGRTFRLGVRWFRR